MNIEDGFSKDLSSLDKTKLDQTDQWILSKLNNITQEVNDSLNSYKMNDAVKKIYNFVWGDYCDWYIEFSKSRIYGDSDEDRDIVRAVAIYVLKDILKLLHPFTPYITEEIWSFFNKDESLLVLEHFPESIAEHDYIQSQSNIELLKELVSSIRNIKSDLGISPKKEIMIYCRGEVKKTDIINSNKHHLSQLVNIKDIECGKNIKKPNHAATIVIDNLEVFLSLEGVIDIDKELVRLDAKIKDIKARLDNVKRKLDNEGFVSKAPEKVVEHEKNKYNSYLENYNKLKENYNNISSK
jgi:valyl-tRNA synthetase